MNGKTVEIKLGGNLHQYSIEINHDSLKNSGEWAKNCLSANAGKIAVVSNKKVFKLYGAKLIESLQAADFETAVWLMPDGEKYKNLSSLEKVLKFFGEHKLSRSDAVVALGGGVVGDLAGFAAAVYLRGIAFVQVPTTLLAMIDSSVGGKTGVNSSFGKNLIGAFHQPNGVLIDVETLQTLENRELTAGFCEAVKHGAISSGQLFNQTSEFLKTYRLQRFKNQFSNPKFLDELEKLIHAQVSFKAEIVKNDEREDIARTDAKSRKILNFGHTLAHALEKITNFKRFKHGEAVGYGMLFAAALSKKLALFDKKELKLFNDVLLKVGHLPQTQDINLAEVFESFAFDKKKVGKHVQFVLLEKIGKPLIHSGENISDSVISETLAEILHTKFAPKNKF